MAALTTWYNSAEYQPLIALRQSAVNSGIGAQAIEAIVSKRLGSPCLSGRTRRAISVNYSRFAAPNLGRTPATHEEQSAEGFDASPIGGEAYRLVRGASTSSARRRASGMDRIGGARLTPAPRQRPEFVAKCASDNPRKADRPRLRASRAEIVPPRLLPRGPASFGPRFHRGSRRLD